MSDTFFKERSEQSKVKAQLVKNYFNAWAGIMASSAQRYGKNENLAFFDLFCGPGRYEDGTVSVPLEILQSATKNPYLVKNLRTFFNDRDEQAIGFLESAIKQIPGIGTLKFEPKISCEEIGENYLEMKDTNIIPSFSFLDPWGYKGLSLGLIEAFIKDWGCDCFFFFNYNRISMGLGNDKVTHHIDALFGEVRAKEVRRKLTEGRFTSEQRANIILENVIGALEDKAGNQKRYVLPFCFKNDSGSRISHYLIFVSKHFKGYDTMKTIMHRASTANTDEAYFSYCPADEVSPLLFGLFKPLESLKNRLTRTYSGQSYYLNKLYEKDSYKTPFIKKNYKDACLELEKEELVEIQRPKPTSPKNSVADNSQIRFV